MALSALNRMMCLVKRHVYNQPGITWALLSVAAILTLAIRLLTACNNQYFIVSGSHPFFGYQAIDSLDNQNLIVSGTYPYFGYQAVDSILLSGLLVICWRGPPWSTLLMIILQETNSV